MVKKLIKLKTEASDWPHDVVTLEQKKAYVQRWKDQLGVDIDIDKIDLNQGLKSVVKLFLVALWGKLAYVVEKSNRLHSLSHHDNPIAQKNKSLVRMTLRSELPTAPLNQADLEWKTLYIYTYIYHHTCTLPHARMAHRDKCWK